MVTRDTAVKLRIKDIAEGEFVKSTERWEPNYLVTPSNGGVSRIRVLATVVSKFVSEDKKYSNITMDDGSSTITVRAFKEKQELLEGIQAGDVVDAVGKPREYLGERYLVPELVNKIKDPNWELVRKLELMLKTPTGGEIAASSSQKVGHTAEVAEEFVASEEQSLVDVQGPVNKPSPAAGKKEAQAEREGGNGSGERILKLIEELDEGDGAKYVSLLKTSNLTEEALESIIAGLLEGGDIYEPKIGRFKKV